MFNSWFFRKRYPLKDKLDLFSYSKKEIKLLLRWIKAFALEMCRKNLDAAQCASRGRNFARKVFSLGYQKQISTLIVRLSTYQYTDLDAEDVALINAAIYRHKYSWPIFWLTFPIQPDRKITQDGPVTGIDLLSHQ